MKISIVLAGFVLIAGVAFAMNEVSQDKTYSWRYKMTVEVETPEGIKSGSAVREVTTTVKTVYYDWADDSNIIFKTKVAGEAVAVDLGARGKVFALLSGYWLGVDHAKRITHYSIPRPDGVENAAEYYSMLKEANVTLEPYQYPVLVAFTDANDPKTVVSLLELDKSGQHPEQYTIKADYFEKYFGEGVRLKQITFEMTEEEVTWGIENMFSWFQEYVGHKGYLGGSQTYPFDDPSKTYIQLSSFRKGL